MTIPVPDGKIARSDLLYLSPFFHVIYTTRCSHFMYIGTDAIGLANSFGFSLLASLCIFLGGTSMLRLYTRSYVALPIIYM